MSSVILAPTAGGGVVLSAENIISALKSTPSVLEELRSLLAVGSPAAKRSPGRPKAVKAEPVAVPSGDQPDAASYRLDDVDADLCQARKLKPSGMDKSWTPTVYRESQCSSKPADGEDLCAGCAKLFEKENDAGKFKHWNGRLGEDPMDHVHMLGTAWASKCKWTGDSAVVASPASPPEPVAAPVAKPAAKVASPAKDAEKAAKEAEKAEKAAAKAAEKAAKEAEKAAKAAEKEAAKAAKEAAKAAKEAEKAAKPKAKKPAKEEEPPAETKAAVETPVVDGDHEPMLIRGEVRMVKNGNVYECDELTQEPGDYLGRLTGTAESPDIDGDAEEELESDAE
jgi:chemotaxis protein histidine kinase CheA